MNTDRFWLWTLDHPWLFLEAYVVVWAAIALGLLFVWAPIGIGWTAGGVFGLVRLILQNFRFERDRSRWSR